MAYLDEFRRSGRPLLAASVGMAFGYTLNNYLGNIFIPPLVHDFHWSRSDVALIGIPAVTGIVFQPLAGRVTDRVGVRAVALFGVLITPLLYVALSLMRGSITAFFALVALQIVLAAPTTGAVVYSRLIAQYFEHARGMALAIAACAPSVAAAALAPFLSRYIGLHGWRRGYLAVAACTALAGLLTLLLIPRGKRPPAAAARVRPRGALLASIVRNPAFKFIVFGMGLCSLSVTVQASQLKFILESMGVDSMHAAIMISIYAAGVITGRLLCGAALDRFPAYAVACVTLGLPGIGLLMLAPGTTNLAATSLAVSVLGLSLGTELDVAGYLIMRYFELEVYSTVVGIIIGAIAVSGASGSLILSVSLHAGWGYSAFLLIGAACALIGSALFWMLGQSARVRAFVPEATKP